MANYCYGCCCQEPPPSDLERSTLIETQSAIKVPQKTSHPVREQDESTLILPSKGSRAASHHSESQIGASASDLSSISEDAKKSILPDKRSVHSYDEDDDSSAYGTSSFFVPSSRKPSKMSINSASNSRSGHMESDMETVYSEEELDETYKNKYEQTYSPDAYVDDKHFGQIRLKVSYEFKKAKLNIDVVAGVNLPGKDKNGPAAYQLRLCLLPIKKRWQSQMVPGPDPKFDGKCVIDDVTADLIPDSGLRMRLYGCERRRRDRLLGETLLAMTSLNLRSANVYMVPLESRHLPKALRQQIQNLNQADQLDRESSVMEYESQFDMPEASALQLPQTVVTEGKVNWPELMLTVNYSAISGRLEVELGQASRLRIPGTTKAPNSYVKMILKSKNDQVLCKCKSTLRKFQANPHYNEKFVFQVATFQLKDVTLMVYMCHKRSIGGKDILGWFAMGANNTGSEEKSHWDEILAAKGEVVTRWHVLHEKTT